MGKISNKIRRRAKKNQNLNQRAEPEYIIKLNSNWETEHIWIECSCGWRDESDTLLKLGLAGKAHRLETGHKMREHK
jgi:hypothetical protein